MNHIGAGPTRLTRADGLPAILAAAYDTFEDILCLLRQHAERAGTEFPAFVLAACEAANGRDWICDAPSLAPADRPQPASDPGDTVENYPLARVVSEIASLSQALVGVLGTAAAGARNLEDRSCCQQAGACAASVCALLGGAPQP